MYLGYEEIKNKILPIKNFRMPDWKSKLNTMAAKPWFISTKLKQN